MVTEMPEDEEGYVINQKYENEHMRFYLSFLKSIFFRVSRGHNFICYELARFEHRRIQCWKLMPF